MQDSSTASVVAAIACLVLVVALSTPAVAQCWTRFQSAKSEYKVLADRYEDEDGVASVESEAAYSDVVPRLTLTIVTVVGGLVSLALAVLATARADRSLSIQQWLHCGTWIVLLFQVTTLFLTPSSTQRYRLGAFGALSSVLLAIAIAVEDLSLRSLRDVPEPHNVFITLTTIHLAAAVIAVITNLLIPRRPDVYHHDKVVDRQNTVSLLIKYTFSWPTPLLQFAANKKSLDYDDLSEIAHDQRSRTLNAHFDQVGKKDRLWKSILLSNKSAVIGQWCLQFAAAFTNFLPSLALLLVLRALEARDAGEDITVRAWLLVISLGLAVTVSSWLESVMFYIAYMKTGLAIYEQLSAVVFGKAMRRKDVKSAGKNRAIGSSPPTEDLTINHAAGSKGEDTAVTAEDDEDDEDDVAKTRQQTINLVGVDGKRVAEFATYSSIFLGSSVKLVIAFAFLVTLIGWIPLLAGLLVPALVTPINIWVSKRYATAQDDLMKVRDQKMAVVTEALQGIRQIKFSALERNWYERIMDMRRKELKTQWQVFVFDASLIAIWIFGPVMLAVVSLTAYAIIHQQLTASVAFTTIAVFESIEMTLAVLPELVTDFLDARVSVQRLEKFLDSPELDAGIQPGLDVSFQNATIAWPSDDAEEEEERFQLRDMTIHFPPHELSVVSGRTGSGKSLLLASIIGEAEVTRGVLRVPPAPPADERYDAAANKQNWIIDSSLAFVSQIPWIENATIQENITFGLPLDGRRYQQVLHACALEKDLEILPDGDLTDIGANGINLSGGQKWRVSFARALYSRAGVLILDDIFSAVDATVGRHLFDEALTGELGRDRTRILVTHHVALCVPKTKYFVLLADGQVQHAGPIEELRRQGHLKTILARDTEEQRRADEEEEKSTEATIDDGGGLQKLLSNRSRRKSGLSETGDDLTRRRSHADNNGHKPTASPKKFTEEEGRASGAIKYQIYAEYVRASGGFSYWVFVMLVFLIGITVFLARSYWISVWTRSYRTEENVSPTHFLQLPAGALSYIHTELAAVQVDRHLWYYLGVYAGISLAGWAIGTGRYCFVFVASIRASKALFAKLAFAVLRAPLRWLDTMPVGRILNRFTADFNMLDSRISYDLAFMLHNGMQVLAVVIAGLFVSPWMIVLAVILLTLSVQNTRRYLAGAREVKRLESTAKSPIFEQFGAVLAGLGTIRAYDKADAYVERMYTKIDRHCRADWHMRLFNRWLAFRLNMIGAGFATIVAALIVGLPGIDASLAGFVLSFSLELSDSVVWMIRQYANVELDMNATERIVEYSNITTEAQSGTPVPAAWPTAGRLEVSDLVVGYAPDLPPVLNGVSFTVEPKQRIGVVGRTGAGKSSLTLALFRFLEARSGSIHIDGVDVSKITLHDLRSRLAIIPQDPVLFSGTVRSNLDAFHQHTDAELYDALARVQLIPSASPSPSTNTNTNTNLFTNLNSKISESGANLSQGQRQLLCLARALVSRPKILVLDEATSAVDMETDTLIQRSIREEFHDCTLVVIAHRLRTVVGFDRILVLSQGGVVEFGPPLELMAREGEAGVFRSMVQGSGEGEELERMIREGETL